MAPYEALYGRPCRPYISWVETENHLAKGQELVCETTYKIRIIRDQL